MSQRGDVGHPALWGERGFGFVEEEETVALEHIFDQPEEGFAVGAAMKALTAVALFCESLLVDLAAKANSDEEHYKTILLELANRHQRKWHVGCWRKVLQFRLFRLRTSPPGRPNDHD